MIYIMLFSRVQNKHLKNEFRSLHKKSREQDQQQIQNKFDTEFITKFYIKFDTRLDTKIDIRFKIGSESYANVRGGGSYNKGYI